MDSAYPWYVLMEVAATGPVDLGSMLEQLLENGMERELVLDGALASSDTQSAQLWQFRESMLEGQRRRGEHLRTDISVPISAIPDFVSRASDEVMAASPECEIIAYGHVGDGNLHFNILPPTTMADSDKKPTSMTWRNGCSKYSTDSMAASAPNTALAVPSRHPTWRGYRLLNARWSAALKRCSIPKD